MSNLETTLVRTTSFLIPEMILFFLNLLWLSCNFLEQKKKKAYYFMIAVLVLLNTGLFGTLDVYLNEIGLYNVHPISDRPTFMIYLTRAMTSAPPLIISALLWKSLQLQKEREESMELKNQVLQAETKALKAQINPHFLFNSMNNIYSLSQMKSEKTGDAILQLSEIMRFVTYESEKDRVNLHEELKQVQNFINLQMLKDDNIDNVKISIEDAKENYSIAPMLLLPFIENSFKHSNFEDKENGWIDIKIKVAQNKLFMLISNSASFEGHKKDETGGVGMENVKKRLTLIYPDKHQLKIRQDKESYNVELELDLN